MSQEKSPEQLLTDTFALIHDAIKKDKKALEGTVKKANKRSKALMTLLFKSEHYVFTKEGSMLFRNALRESSEEIGHALYMVLTIENKRAGLTINKTEEENKKPVASTTPQVLVQSTPAIPQLPGGASGWLQARTAAKSAEKIQKMLLKAQEKAMTPKIATSEQVIDILEFGRQLIPEFNRIHLYFQQCLDHLHFFGDKETEAFFHGELSTHLNKLVSIIQSFCRTVAEYRKSVLDQSTMELAKGMAEVVVASMMGQAGGIGPRFAKFRPLRDT